MTAFGKITLVSGALSVTNIYVIPVAIGLFGNITVALINSEIIPKVQGSLQLIPIPNLSNIYGSGFSVSIREARVIPAPAMEIGATFVGRSATIANADFPAQADLNRLDAGINPHPLVIGLISVDAVNHLSTGNAKKSFYNTANGILDSKASISGKYQITKPLINIAGGNATISCILKFSELKAGIKPGGPLPWIWTPLVDTNINLRINHRISSTNRVAYIELLSLASFSLSFNFPSILDPLKGLLTDLLSTILSPQIKTSITAFIRGQSREIFRLPNTIPGTNLRSNLKFAPNGVGYYNKSIKALIVVEP